MPSTECTATPSGLDLWSPDGPEDIGVDGGYGVVTEVMEVSGGYRRVTEVMEIMDKGTGTTETYREMW